MRISLKIPLNCSLKQVPKLSKYENYISRQLNKHYEHYKINFQAFQFMCNPFKFRNNVKDQ